MKALTQKQAAVLAYIKEFIVEFKFSPTRSEIGDHFKIRPNAAQVRVEGLLRKGAVTHVKGKSRSTYPVEGFVVTIK